MTEVFWLEQMEADLPTDDHWLSVSELARLQGLRFPKRRDDWQLGRWTAKRAVAASLGLSDEVCKLASVEIRATPCGAPEVLIANQPAGATISLSHSAGVAFCTVTKVDAVLGCDLECIEQRSGIFVADYFTTEEQALVARTPALHRPAVVALIWSAKESALKALREGLRMDTRSVAVSLFGDGDRPDAERIASFFRPFPDTDDWRPLAVRYDEDQIFKGWGQCVRNQVRTIVAVPAPATPVLLHVPACARTV